MIILEERQETCIVLNDDGTPNIIPNTEYHKLKLMAFNGKRILYPFQELVKAEETYNSKVFNCFYGSDHVTIRGRDADEVCRAIRRHKEGHGLDDYREIFGTCYSREHKTEIIEDYMKKLDSTRIKIKHITDKDNKQSTQVIIDGMFMIDEGARSYVKFNEDHDHWKFVCTVADIHCDKYRIPVKGYCYTEITGKTMEIIAKVLFHCYPNLDDRIFTNQLPDYVMKILRDKEQERKT